MGVQAHERQDELFDLRSKNSRLLIAMMMMVCGNGAEQSEGRTILREMANDPLMAKNVVRVLENLSTPPEEGSFAEDILHAANFTLGRDIAIREPAQLAM